MRIKNLVEYDSPNDFYQNGKAKNKGQKQNPYIGIQRIGNNFNTRQDFYGDVLTPRQGHRPVTGPVCEKCGTASPTTEPVRLPNTSRVSHMWCAHCVAAYNDTALRAAPGTSKSVLLAAVREEFCGE